MLEKRGKKAAIEMSMSTVIIIVLAVSFLILGLILLRNIFGNATTSMGTIDDKLKNQLSSLFADEEQQIFIKPDDGQLKIRAGTTNFGFVIGARTRNGNDVAKRSDIQYRLVLDKNAPNNCLKKITEAKVRSWFVGSKIATGESDLTYNSITDYKADQGFVRIQIDLPSGTVLCTQTVYYDFVDKTDPTLERPIGGGSFTVEVIRKSLL
jgi:hypothetical protein